MKDFAYYDPSDPSVVYVTQPDITGYSVAPKPPADAGAYPTPMPPPSKFPG